MVWILTSRFGRLFSVHTTTILLRFYLITLITPVLWGRPLWGHTLNTQAQSDLEHDIIIVLCNVTRCNIIYSDGHRISLTTYKYTKCL